MQGQGQGQGQDVWGQTPPLGKGDATLSHCIPLVRFERPIAVLHLFLFVALRLPTSGLWRTLLIARKPAVNSIRRQRLLGFLRQLGLPDQRSVSLFQHLNPASVHCKSEAQ